MSLIGRLFRSLILHMMVPAIFLGMGWYAGAKYGAPDILIRAVDGVIARAQAVLSPIIAEGVERSSEIAADVVEQGGEYVVGTVEQTLEELAEPSAPENEDPAQSAEPAQDNEGSEDVAQPNPENAPGAASLNGESNIVLCQMRISNAPRGGQPGDAIGRADETILYKGVSLLLMPATKSCLSSGYGYRNGRLHRGVDYFSDRGGDVLAAGDGVIVEAVMRSDYGNMIVIDHGNSVFTRYAHLARFGQGVREGARVTQGDVLGPIGNTGVSSIVHLHYELLTGDYNTNARSFGLAAVDPFDV